MSKFNVGDTVWFKTKTNYVAYHIAEIDGDIAYMEEGDTDIPLKKLLTNDEYYSSFNKSNDNNMCPEIDMNTDIDLLLKIATVASLAPPSLLYYLSDPTVMRKVTKKLSNANDLNNVV